MVIDQSHVCPKQLLAIILIARVVSQLPSCGMLPTTKTLVEEPVVTAAFVKRTATSAGPASAAFAQRKDAKQEAKPRGILADIASQTSRMGSELQTKCW